MRICWSRSAERPAPDQRIINHVTAADEDASASTAYSATSINLTTWISQWSSSFTTIWGNSASDPVTITLRQIIANSNFATHKFRFDMVVGKGGFGNVYKDWLKEKVQPRGIRKTLIAIKKLDLESAQGFREWIVCVSKSYLHLFSPLCNCQFHMVE